MEKNIAIHETAFMTSIYREKHQDISKDPYAYLWSHPKTEVWIRNIAKEVSPYEAVLHSLRNRYFLETIKHLFLSDKIKVLINFGAGFSMYPYALPEGLIHIEIDQPNVISYKKEKVSIWETDKTVPKRNIHYIATDFNTAYEEQLLSKIEAIQKNMPSFILIEGVLFFLSRKDTDRLFHFFSHLQQTGGYVGSVSFQDTIETTPAFNRLLDFFNRRLQGFSYQTIPDTYYKNLKSYRLIDHQDAHSLQSTYATSQKIPKDILNEHMYLLQTT